MFLQSVVELQLGLGHSSLLRYNKSGDNPQLIALLISEISE